MSAPRAADALFVGAVKLVTSAIVLAMGFRAVSDDDYSRLVIAQRFAEAPSLDPSGTSWLPVPFWTYGGAFALFGNGLGVARAVALVLGVASVVLVLVAAHWLGAGRLGALLAAVVASVFSWSALLGASWVPEAPTAGLVVLGIAALSVEDVRRRTLGALALAAACFSRYEAWPVACVFLVLTAVDARRLRARALAVPACVAVLPIALWLAHGAVRHDDAFFFWKRVASYQHALGGGPSRTAAFFGPLVTFFHEGWVLAVAVVLALRVRRIGARELAPYARGLVCCGALLLFLCAGALGGGAPTHHEARALLPVWFFFTVILGRAGSDWLEERPRRRTLVSAVMVPFLVVVLLRDIPEDFARRDLELHIGDQARRLGAPALLVDTTDYGYFAVDAAFRKPRASMPVVDHDPRKGRQKDAFESVESLRRRLADAPKAWLVATEAHASLAATLGSVRARNADFTLVEPR